MSEAKVEAAAGPVSARMSGKAVFQLDMPKEWPAPFAIESFRVVIASICAAAGWYSVRLALVIHIARSSSFKGPSRGSLGRPGLGPRDGCLTCSDDEEG